MAARPGLAAIDLPGRALLGERSVRVSCDAELWNCRGLPIADLGDSEHYQDRTCQDEFVPCGTSPAAAYDGVALAVMVGTSPAPRLQS